MASRSQPLRASSRRIRSPPAPAALYGITKLASEQAALRIGDLHMVSICASSGSARSIGPWELQTGVARRAEPALSNARMASTAGSILPRTMPSDWIYSRDAAPASQR